MDYKYLVNKYKKSKKIIWDNITNINDNYIIKYDDL
jgi:hypothetical protein